MKKYRLLSLILCVILVLGIASMNVYGYEDNYYADTQSKVESHERTWQDSAYILFSDNDKMEGMSYIEPNGAGRNDELYSEEAEFKGVKCRQVYVQNYFYLKLDEDFASEEDRVFSISFDYWDYGGGGYFYVEYLPRGASEYRTIQVLKLGLDENNVKTEGTWFRATIYVDDAQFTGEMPHGADFRIRSGAYNAFSKIEVRNLSRSVGETEEFGYFNKKKADGLHKLGLFDGYGAGEEYEPCLDKKLTREEAIVQMIKSYGAEKIALEKKITSTYTDVSSEAAPYVGYAQSLGVLENGTVLGANETFTQQELLIWYLRLIGVEDENLSQNAYELAWENGLLSRIGMIFQPKKEATVDNFVMLAFNAYTITNKKTGYNPFTELFEKGVYTTQTISDMDDETLWNWLEQTPFVVPSETHTDIYTQREYNTVDFLGQSAMKAYYTQNCMSMDGKKIFFEVPGSKLYEYNIETGKCRYIGELRMTLNQMVTPLNNLWYLDRQAQIVKVDLETYEQTVMGELPSWQNKSMTYMMQVNNDESKVSFEWTDGSGEFDSNYHSRLPIYDVNKKEWDLRFSWGFETPRYYVDHQCINPNPKYSNYLFFAHDEATTREKSGVYAPQPDRVWMLNTDTNEYYNFFKQKWYIQPKNGNLQSGYSGEGSVHEAWSPDGEWMIFVKNRYANSGVEKTIGLGQAVLMRPDGTDKRYIPADYTFTHMNGGDYADGMVHAMISPDNRWIVADSTYNPNKGWSDLYLVDSYTGGTYHLARLSQKGVDPGHIHPQFSPDGKKVIFGLWSDDKSHSKIGWMDVSDIVDNAPKGGNYKLSDSCSTFGYEGYDTYLIPKYDENGNQTGIKIPGGNQMYIDVNKNVTESDNTPATISITYKDDSKLPLRVTYYTWNVNSNYDTNRLAEHKTYIEREGRGGIVTKTIKLDDICLGNMQILGSDFRIAAVGADATIISVDVSVNQ